VSSSEHDDEPLGSIKGWGFSISRTMEQILEKESAPSYGMDAGPTSSRSNPAKK
jgi:hypothetical protein